MATWHNIADYHKIRELRDTYGSPDGLIRQALRLTESITAKERSGNYVLLEIANLLRAAHYWHPQEIRRGGWCVHPAKRPPSFWSKLWQSIKRGVVRW